MMKDQGGEQSNRNRSRAELSLPSGCELETRLKLRQVSVLTGWGRTKIYKEIKAGRFPAPERSSLRCSRWRAGTVIASLNAGRNQAACTAGD
jgi:predicted DNA-binding transcriptional regulator AlpA